MDSRCTAGSRAGSAAFCYTAKAFPGSVQAACVACHVWHASVAAVGGNLLSLSPCAKNVSCMGSRGTGLPASGGVQQPTSMRLREHGSGECPVWNGGGSGGGGSGRGVCVVLRGVYVLNSMLETGLSLSKAPLPLEADLLGSAVCQASGPSGVVHQCR